MNTISAVNTEEWIPYFQSSIKELQHRIKKISDDKARHEMTQLLDILTKHFFEISRDKYNLVFIGNIGVGKSTAISHLFNLMITTEKGNETILHTSTGRTTVGQVTIESTSHQYPSINIHPYSEKEFIHKVKDFCAYQWKKEKGVIEEFKESQEISRAIKNMASLGSSKSNTNNETIKNIIDISLSEEDFFNKIKARINISKRTMTTITYDASHNQPWKSWIKKIFQDVNNGLIPTVPLPQEIVIKVPSLVFDETLKGYTISIIDTKGIEDNIYRKDLDDLIRDGRSILIFCSSYSEAPQATIRDLIHQMSFSPKRHHIPGKSTLLVLPKNQEGLNTTYDDGEPVDSVEEGYQHKEEQIRQELKTKIDIKFYDKTIDKPESIRQYICNQIIKYKEFHLNEAICLEGAIKIALTKIKEKPYRDAVFKVEEEIRHFLEKRRIPFRLQGLPENIINEFRKGHASSIWASVRRNGFYPPVDFYYIASRCISNHVNILSLTWHKELSEFINLLRQKKDYNSASERIVAIENIINETIENFIIDIGNSTVSLYKSQLQNDIVWTLCSQEWGKGQGFKDRVCSHLILWMKNHKNITTELQTLIEKRWNNQVIEELLIKIKRTPKK